MQERLLSIRMMQVLNSVIVKLQAMTVASRSHWLEGAGHGYAHPVHAHRVPLRWMHVRRDGRAPDALAQAVAREHQQRATPTPLEPMLRQDARTRAYAWCGG
eukprot:13589639-Heterocapsa_arctica.AAC.1